MAIFIEYPWLAAAVGVLFVALGRWARRRMTVGVGVTCILYSAYETAMHLRWLCSGECNIRVDLLLIYPVLLLASLAAAFNLVRARRTQRTRSS